MYSRGKSRTSSLGGRGADEEQSAPSGDSRINEPRVGSRAEISPVAKLAARAAAEGGK